MKNTKLIIKIAVIVSAIASLFSIVTLIRAIIIKANIVLPIIQVVGSLAIFAVCFVMFRMLSKAAGDEEDDEEPQDDEQPAPEEKMSDKQSGSSKRRQSRRQKDSEEQDAAGDETPDPDQAEKEADELYEKYHLSEFEKKNDEY